MSVGVPTDNGLRLGLTPWEGDAADGGGPPAHFIEQAAANKLIRPLSRYTGPSERKVTPISQR